MSHLGPCPRCGEMLPGLAQGAPPTVHCLRCGAGYIVGGPPAAPMFPPPAHLPPPPMTFSPPRPPMDSEAIADQQFMENPLGYIINGPQLPEYQANGNARVLSKRRWQFSFWVVWLLAILFSAFILPFFSLPNGGDGAFVAFAGNFLLFVICIPFFATGMLLFAGGLFEWGWFFNSRKGRRKRGAFGDSGARIYFMVIGGILMVPSGTIALGGCLLNGIAHAYPKESLGPGVADGAPGQPQAEAVDFETLRREAERQLDESLENVAVKRRKLEGSTRSLQDALDKIETTKSQVESRPNDLSLRTLLAVDQRSVAKLFESYSYDARDWLATLDRVDEAARRAGKNGSELQIDRNVPNGKVYKSDILPRAEELFPVDEVVATSKQLAELKKRLQGVPTGTDGAAVVGETLSKIELLRRRLLQVENAFGYRDPELEGLPESTELNRALLASSGRNFDGFSKGASPRRELPTLRKRQIVDLMAAFESIGTPYTRNVHFEPRISPPRLTLNGSTGVASAGFRVPLIDPGVYRMSIERTKGEGPLYLVVPVGEHRFPIVIDAVTPAGRQSGLTSIEDSATKSNPIDDPTAYRPLIPLHHRADLSMTINQGQVVVKIGANVCATCFQEGKDLPLHPMFDFRGDENLLVGCKDAEFRIEMFRCETSE